MTCPNCQFETPEADLCSHCGAALRKAPQTKASLLSVAEDSGVPGGCIAAIAFNFAVLFGGARGLLLLSSRLPSCLASRVALWTLAALALVVVGVAGWRVVLRASTFWLAFALGVFVPFLPCAMGIVGQDTTCLSR